MQSSPLLFLLSVPVFSNGTTRISLYTENGFYADHQIFWGLPLKHIAAPPYSECGPHNFMFCFYRHENDLAFENELPSRSATWIPFMSGRPMSNPMQRVEESASTPELARVQSSKAC